MLVQVHRIMVSAMKTKQSLDTENTDKLEEAIKAFQKIYVGNHKH